MRGCVGRTLLVCEIQKIIGEPLSSYSDFYKAGNIAGYNMDDDLGLFVIVGFSHNKGWTVPSESNMIIKEYASYQYITIDALTRLTV